MTERLRVVFVASSERSGSTLVGRLLGELPGAFFAGELGLVWKHGVGLDALCGCGAKFRTCPVWAPIIDLSYGSWEQAPSRAPVDLCDPCTNRHLLRHTLIGGKAFQTKLILYGEEAEKLLRAAVKTQNAEFVVDTTKYPFHGLALAMRPGVDLRILHLVRDPRAVAHSMSARKYDPSIKGKMAQIRTTRSVVRWMYHQWLISASLRNCGVSYRRIRYEDIVADPNRRLEEIAQSLGSVWRNQVKEDGSIRLGVSHGPSGNPRRFETGIVPLREDLRWRREMARGDAALCGVLAAPLSFRYGYSVFR